MVDRKQVNVDRLSPAFFRKISPTCSEQKWGVGPGRDRKKKNKKKINKTHLSAICC